MKKGTEEEEDNGYDKRNIENKSRGRQNLEKL